MEWLRAGAVACAVVAAFWGPGLLVGWAARLRGLGLLAAAPLLTLGVAGPAAIAVALLGVPWDAASASVAVLVTAGLVGACSSRGRDAPPAGPVPRAQGSTRVWLLVSVLAGVLAQLVPVAVGMGRPGRLLTGHDAVAHLTMVRFARESGVASSLRISDAHTLDGTTQGFYGAGWHAVTALLGDVPDASTVFNTAVLVPCALAWTLGLVALTMSTFPSRPRAWCFAAVASGAGVALPVLLVMRPEGMIANAVAVALVPSFAALVTAPWSRLSPARWCVLALGTAGLALTHPNAAAAGALVVLPWAVLRARPRVVRLLRGRTGRAVLAVASAVAVGAVAWFAGTDSVRAVYAYEPEPPRRAGDVAVALLTGDATGMGCGAGVPVVLAALVGGALSWRSPRARWLVLASALLAALYVAATSPVPVLTDVDRVWYGEPRRFAPVMVAVLVPLASRALDALPGALRLHAARRARGSPASARPVRAGGALLAVAVLLMSAVSSGVGLSGLSRYTFGDGVPAEEAQVADDAELAMLVRAGQLLDPEVGVLGSSFSGATHLYGLHGQRVVPPTYLTVENEDLRYLRLHLDDLGQDPEVCAALGRLGVGYLYADPLPWNWLPTHVNPLTAPDRGVRLLDAGGSARLYEITAC
ncbi:DUF6541 family protein [Cellulomonas cellasea]|uniref:Glycosyltransferase RgtA/B/C/D-like domain-containing protein n=2 Tax=Cellulomonas cellasea TaxID=43670 RepID=A0A0A0BAN3_9CELL|nr:DUF6541 family protein [Cellulomonas cellasea]KGM02899.1 hypothetical protein Q760_10765 [Cellulomonas cellasea DSM 20118]GEA88799.1 hypothetical protein CCE01nite_27480 [Cellulomonas cellasea]